jgi:hypothetical protein
MGWRTSVAGGGLALALAVSGCSGGNGAKVATLGGGTDSSSSSSSASKQSFEDALVEYTKCMREHGVDMPDPQFTSNGDGGQGGFAVMGGPANASEGGAIADPNGAAFKAADEACKPILDAVTKDMPKPSPEELAKQRDQALAFAKCMREHGVDMPDPTFDDNGGISIAAPAAGGGGVDPKAMSGPDQAFQDAAKACQQDGGPGLIVNGSGPGGDAGPSTKAG